MAVPSWTKEWRPLVRELCAHTRASLRLSANSADDGAPSDAYDAPNSTDVRSEDEREARQRVNDALAVDRVVAQLYAHRFLEVHRKQVADELDAIAVKLHVHSLGERGERIRDLAARVVDDHHQVLKLLIELAETPTAASDTAVALDPDAAALVQHEEEQRAMDREQELHEQLAEELFEISTSDEWYQQWDDSDDGDDDDDDYDSAGSDGDLSVAVPTSTYDVNARSLRIGRKQLEPLTADDDTLGGDDDDPMTSGASLLHENNSGDGDESGEDAEIQARDALLLQYYPKTTLSSTSVRRSSSASARETAALPLDHDEPMTGHDLPEPIAVGSRRDASADATAPVLSLETPSLLYAALAPERQQPEAPSPLHRIVHERALVACVFQAFAGVDSLVFDVTSSGATLDLAAVVDRDGARVALSPSARGVAVAHLSPSALHHALDHFARAASDLQLLRDVVTAIAHDPLRLHCCTLEGLAQALATVVRECDRAIWRVEQCAFAHCRQLTLLTLMRDLKPHCTKIAWLTRVVSTCVRGLGGLNDARGVAARAKHVLDALYAQLEVEYVQGVDCSASTRNSSRQLERRESDPSSVSDDESDSSSLFASSRVAILLHLFVCAVTPYLDLLQTLLFERGHRDTVALHDELFFVTPTAAMRTAPVAPSSADARTDPSFHDALCALAPFEVDVSRVPVFLAPAIASLNEAVASRQMTNRYVQQQQQHRDVPTADKSTSSSSLRALVQLRRHRKLSASGAASHATLSELFLDDLARSGVYIDHSQEATALRHHSAAMPTAAQLSVQSMPFSRTIKQCLLQHVEHKCRELNGAMASLFRERLQFLEHVDALRSFVLMQQQDVFAMLSDHLLEQLQTNPITWADGESLNRFFHSTLHRLDDERAISATMRDASARICVRINATQLKALGLARTIDIAALKCLYFTVSTPQPLRVLFSASILRKYSRLATFLLQVKAVASAITKFKRHVRHKRCFPLIERDLRSVLVQMSDMLHYTTSLLNYLASQVASATWDSVRRELETVESIAAMDRAHEQYLDQLLAKFFLLEKHTTVIQYILTTFNHIMRFVSHVDELVRRLERTASDKAQTRAQGVAASSTPQRQQLSWDLGFHKDHAHLHDEIAKSASEFKRQSHFLVVMLSAMHKHGASPHVAEILTQLNFNDFYHQTQPQHSPRRSRP